MLERDCLREVTGWRMILASIFRLLLAPALSDSQPTETLRQSPMVRYSYFQVISTHTVITFNTEGLGRKDDER